MRQLLDGKDVEEKVEDFGVEGGDAAMVRDDCQPQQMALLQEEENKTKIMYNKHV